MSDLSAPDAAENERLRRCLNDLVTVTALPSVWTGGDLVQIGNTLLEALDTILDVDFLFLLLTSPREATGTELARLSRLGIYRDAGELGEHLRKVFGSSLWDWPHYATLEHDGTSYGTIIMQLGLNRTAGVLVAGSRRKASFPSEQDRLILNVAANQVALATNEASRLSQQQHIAVELDRLVAKRTTELGVANDALRKQIVERQQTEEALHTSELSARLIVDSMSVLVATLSPQGTVQAANARLIEYCGIDAGEFGSWGTTECIHPDDRDAARATFAGSAPKAEAFNCELRLRRNDGIHRWFEVRGVPLLTAPSSILRWYVFLTDVEDRKRADEARATNVRELNKIINAIPVMAWSTLADGTADFFNEHFLSFLGITSEEAHGWGWMAALHPEDAENLTGVWAALMASKRPGETEARLRRSDGQYRWFLFRANPVYAEDGSVTRWYGTNTDIDDRKRAEEALRKSAAFLAQGQMLTDTGSIWWKPLTQEVFWSDEAYRVEGYQKSRQPSVKLMFDRCHPDDLTEVQAVVAKAAEDGANLELEHRLLMPDGKVKYVRFVLQNIGPDRLAPEFIGAITDITQRKMDEEQLRRSEVLLAEGQRISLTGTFSWQVDTDEITFSSELHRIFGFPPDAVVDFPSITERVYHEDLPLLAEKMSNVRSGSDNPDYEIRLSVSDRVKYVRVVGRVIKHLNGTTECLGAVQDVTAQRLAEEARDKLRSELAQIARVMSLSTMAAAIAHEVNQPLSGIVTNASTSVRMLSADPPNIDGARETARRTIRDANRAADVITRLRVLFKRGTSTFEPVDINDAAIEVISLLSTDMQRHRISLRAELCETLPFVGGDRVQLQQVIMNFLRNSIDAIGDRSQHPRDIVLRTELAADRALRLSVEDTGCGIGSAEADQLFDAFHTTKADGMGIGLSISRSIVEAHGGEIWGRSNPEIGATFGFSIPDTSEQLLNDGDKAFPAGRS